MHTKTQPFAERVAELRLRLSMEIISLFFDMGYKQEDGRLELDNFPLMSGSIEEASTDMRAVRSNVKNKGNLSVIVGILEEEREVELDELSTEDLLELHSELSGMSGQ